jgi:hypothetical protein
VIFIGFAVYDHSNLLPFRVLTFSVAALSWWLLQYTGHQACAITDTDPHKDDDHHSITVKVPSFTPNGDRIEGKQANTHSDKHTSEPDAQAISSPHLPIEQSTSAQARSHSFLEVAFQVARMRNFIIFVMMNFLQVFDVTVSAGFFVIYERHLLGGSNAWPAASHLFVIGASFLLPQVFVFSVTPLIVKYGSYAVIM